MAQRRRQVRPKTLVLKQNDILSLSLSFSLSDRLPFLQTLWYKTLILTRMPPDLKPFQIMAQSIKKIISLYQGQFATGQVHALLTISLTIERFQILAITGLNLTNLIV